MLQAVGAALLPGRSLTRRLIWLAALWILGALIATGMVLTSQFQESGLRRLGGVLNTTIDSDRVITLRLPSGVCSATDQYLPEKVSSVR